MDPLIKNIKPKLNSFPGSIIFITFTLILKAEIFVISILFKLSYHVMSIMIPKIILNIIIIAFDIVLQICNHSKIRLQKYIHRRKIFTSEYHLPKSFLKYTTFISSQFSLWKIHRSISIDFSTQISSFYCPLVVKSGTKLTIYVVKDSHLNKNINLFSF